MKRFLKRSKEHTHIHIPMRIKKRNIYKTKTTNKQNYIIGTLGIKYYY